MSEQSTPKTPAATAATGAMGQRYLAEGTSVALRLWEEQTSNDPKPAVARDYETVGYVIAGRARLHTGAEVTTLGPGDSWLVPRGVEHTYEILEPLTAVEATAPPAQQQDRDADPS